MLENHGVQVAYIYDHNVVGVQEYLLERNNQFFKRPLFVFDHMDTGVTDV
jgi:hypothetical protein